MSMTTMMMATKFNQDDDVGFGAICKKKKKKKKKKREKISIPFVVVFRIFNTSAHD